MKINVYATYDAQARAYGSPLFLQTDGLAKRAFTDACNNPESNFAKYPNDYALYSIGTYDDDTADLVGHPPQKIISVLEVLK